MSRLKLNLTLLYAGEGLAKLLALFAWGHIGHTLTSGPYGLLVLPLGIYFVANQLLDAGLAPFGAREAARHPARTEVLAARIAWIRICLVGGALLVLGGLAAGLVGRPDEVRLLVILFGAALLPMPLIVNWAFEARDEMQVVAGGTLLRQVVFAGSVVFLVEVPQDVFWVPLCEAAGLFAQAGVHQVAFGRRFRAFLPLRGIRGAMSVLRESVPLGASTVFSALRWFSPVLLFAATTDDEHQSAYLESSLKIAVSLHTFVWLYFVNLLPSMSRFVAAKDRAAWRNLSETSMSLVAWTVVPVLLVGFALAPVLIPMIYGETFGPAVGLFQVLVWMLFFAFLSGHHRYGLIAFREQRSEMKASAAGVVVSAGGAVLLLAVGALTPLHAALLVVAGEATTLVFAGRMLTRRVERLPWVRDVAPVLLPAGLALALWWWIGRESPWLAAILVVASFGIGGALLRPRFLSTLSRGGEPPEPPPPTDSD